MPQRLNPTPENMPSNMTKRIAGGALLLLVIAFGISASMEDLGPRVQEHLNSLRAEFKARPTSREPVGGPAQEGLAWASYWEASDKLKARPNSLFITISDDALAACLAGPAQRRAESLRLAALIEEELALLREGARRRDTSPYLSPKSLDLTKTLSLSKTRATSNLLGLLGVAELEAGNEAEGLAVLLDAMQIAQDYTHAATLINQIIGTSGFIPLSFLSILETEGFGLLSPTALEALDVGVGRLVTHAPRMPNFSSELLVMGHAALLDPQLEFNSSDGFVDRILHSTLTLGELFIHAYEVNLTLDGASAREAMAMLRMTRGPANQGGLTDTWESASRSNRHAVARLHMLHHAIRLAQGLEPEHFEDPFEMPLIVTETDEMWTLEVGSALGADRIEMSFHR